METPARDEKHQHGCEPGREQDAAQPIVNPLGPDSNVLRGAVQEQRSKGQGTAERFYSDDTRRRNEEPTHGIPWNVRNDDHSDGRHREREHDAGGVEIVKCGVPGQQDY
jgi:hypothetical protein